MHRSLRLILRVNAVFSLATGMLLAVAPGTVGAWLGVTIDGWLRLLGIGLIGHFAVLWWAQARPDPRPLAKLNLLSIAPYPLLMIGLVAFGLVERNLGRGLVLVDGLIVGVIAWGHLRELKAPSSPPVSTMP